MTVIVVGRWQVPDGDADRAIASARRELGLRGAAPPARRVARLFQAIDDARTLLYVGEWADRAAFERYRADAEAGTVEAAIRDSGEFLICERRLFFGNYAYRAGVIGCAIVEAPAEASDALRDLLVPNGRWVLHGAPGLVHYAVHREVTHTRRYVVVHGWQSEAALAASRGRGQHLRDALASIGGSIVEFSGHERASTDHR
jgi:quinol monooxygenase YgiN